MRIHYLSAKHIYGFADPTTGYIGEVVMSNGNVGDQTIAYWTEGNDGYRVANPNYFAVMGRQKFPPVDYVGRTLPNTEGLSLTSAWDDMEQL